MAYLGVVNSYPYFSYLLADLGGILYRKSAPHVPVQR